jgi:hypothetical protein
MTAGCPSDETFTRLVEGLLSETEIRDLEAHCDGCITCARLMAELARSVSPSGGGLLDDRYRLLEPLGAGGMGVVYAALDTKLGRKVAIKRLRETGTGTPAEKRRGRFMREAQLLASLSHPNVLTIHDVGGADRELYVVMELIDGAPVSRWRIEKRPGWRRIVDIFLQAGRGLVAAHQLGIVHRDIKPDNILVANNGRVLVGDFGLAGLAGSLTPGGDPSPSTAPAPGSLTQTGTVLGTPAYMSPEQHDGKTGDALSDQFSFAVSLYESLHERRPFPGRSAGEIAAATRSGPLAPGGDGVPRGIDRALAIALDPDPIRRYASMEDLLGALEQAVDRRPAAVWLAGAAVLILAGAVGARVWLHRAPAPVAHPAPAVQAAAAPAPTPTKIAPPPAPSAEIATDGGTHAAAPSAHHRRQVAQAQLPGQAPTPAPQIAPPVVVTQVQILARAEQHKYRREGAACLAALAEATGPWSAEIAERAQRARGSCEMLVGHCDEGRKLLEPIYMNQRTAEAVAQGLLSRDAAELCPISSFPTVQKRLTAIAIQANAANGDARNQAQWCGALERVLLKDTRSSEIQACFAEFAGFKPTAPCGYLLADVREAYRYLAECFLRDKNCREGARLDVMHTQLEVVAVATDDPRVARWCKPSRVVEMYPSCATAAEEAERQCMERVEAAQRSGVERLRPEVLPR